MCEDVLVSVVSVMTDEIKYPFEIMYVILWFTCKIWIVENQSSTLTFQDFTDSSSLSKNEH